MQFPLPPHILSIKDDAEYETARVRFLIKMGALYFSPEGTVQALSKALGRHPNSLSNCISIGGATAIALEDALNNPLFTRQVFAPTVFPAKE